MGAALLGGFLVMLLVQAALEHYSGSHAPIDTIEGGATPRVSEVACSHPSVRAATLAKPLLNMGDDTPTANADDQTCLTVWDTDAFEEPQRQRRSSHCDSPDCVMPLTRLEGAAAAHSLKYRRGASLDCDTTPPRRLQSPALSLAPSDLPNSSAHQALGGLLMHAAADGLAVGTAGLAASVSISVAVAIAMTMHKGPVSFGLVAFLRGSGWSTGRVVQALVLFAGVSPLTALLTYYLLAHVPGITAASNVALMILFSGGTFLHAACMHILPSVLGPHGSKLNTRRTVAIVVAACLPLLVVALIPEDS